MAPPSGPLDDRLITHLWEAHAGRLDEMRYALKAMKGEHPASIAISDDTDDNVRLNLPRLITDSQVQGLFGKAPEWEADRDVPQLDAWRKATENRWDLTCQALAENGAWSGMAFLKIDTTGPAPRLIALDPIRWLPVHDPDDVDDTYAYIGRWPSIDAAGKRIWRRQLVERLANGSWQVRDQASREADRGYRDIAVNAWDYPWPPVDHAQNLPAPNECWGRPDLTRDVVDLAYAVNRNVSNANKVSRLWAHPKIVGFGFDGANLTWGPDEMPVVGNKDARIDVLTVSGDTAKITDLAAVMRGVLHLVARTPDVGADKLERVGALSGVALKLLYGPAEGIFEQKHLTYGPFLGRAQQHLAELNGWGDPGGFTITWQDPVPTDPLAIAQALQIWVSALGLSKETALDEGGYDPDQEAERKAEEAATAAEQAAQLVAAGGVDQLTNQPPAGGSSSDGGSGNGA